MQISIRKPTGCAGALSESSKCTSVDGVRYSGVLVPYPDPKVGKQYEVTLTPTDPPQFNDWRERD